MLYAITNRQLYGSNEAVRYQRLLEYTALWAIHGVQFIQLREKDLSGRDLVQLARAMLQTIRASASRMNQQYATSLLINGRPDVTLAVGADGVHLPSGHEALTPGEVRAVVAESSATAGGKAFVSIACHSLEEIDAARRQQADCILFAPVFEKKIVAANDTAGGTLPGTGLTLLAQACRTAAPIPVFALGGVTADNAPQCVDAGAVGIAAIRLMLEPPSAWRNLVR